MTRSPLLASTLDLPHRRIARLEVAARSVVVLRAALGPSELATLCAACTSAGARMIFAEEAGFGSHDLLVAGLRAGERRVPWEVQARSGARQAHVPVLLVCEDKLVRSPTVLDDGRVTLVDRDTVAYDVAELVRLLLDPSVGPPPRTRWRGGDEATTSIVPRSLGGSLPPSRKSSSLADLDFSSAFAKATIPVPDESRVSLSRGLAEPDTRRETPLPPRAFGREPAVAVGTVLDKYRVEALVGAGAFAHVFRATHELLHMPVAIKTLRPELQQEAASARRLVEEARCAARIHHPNVVRIHDVTATPRLSYIVMEYIEGRSLAQTIRAAGRLSVDSTLRVGLDIIRGLQAGHEAGLVHRDIKPANILCGRRGGARIVDFGLARAFDDRADRGIVGTRGYWAPEVAKGEPVDFRADLYSFGVVLLEAITGMQADEHDPLADLPASASHVRGLLATLLAKAPSERPTSHARVEREIVRLLGAR